VTWRRVIGYESAQPATHLIPLVAPADTGASVGNVYMNSVRATGVLASNSRSLVDWLTGAGFLMLHATGFFVALVILIPWNLYTDPGDFWAADPLIRWAFLLAFHALLVGVWSLIRTVILKEADDSEDSFPAARSWQSARATSTPVNFRTSRHPNEVAESTASALLAEEWARQWLVDSGEEITPAHYPESNGSAWAGHGTATAPLEWPLPPAASSSLPGEEEDAEAGPHVANLVETPRTAGPLGAAARASNDASGTSDTLDPELEWRWIEAAASAWLTRKERESYTSGQVPPPGYSGDDSAGP